MVCFTALAHRGRSGAHRPPARGCSVARTGHTGTPDTTLIRELMATDYRIPVNKLVRPDKDRFLDEENPFEAMMSRFDKAAELLDLEPGLYKVLRQAEKQVIVSIPVMMDNGQIDVFEGYRVQ